MNGARMESGQESRWLIRGCAYLTSGETAGVVPLRLTPDQEGGMRLTLVGDDQSELAFIAKDGELRCGSFRLQMVPGKGVRLLDDAIERGGS